MKKIYLLFLILFTFTTTVVFSQTSHDKISYQSVVRDGNNHLLYDTTVTVVVTIKNSGDPAVKYRETHTVMSNANGLISFLIGDGDNQNGNWNAVQWNHADITLVTSVNGTVLSTHTYPLSAVPYALYAKNAATSDYADSVDLDVVQHFIETSGYLTDELQVLSIGNDTIYLSQGGYVKLPAGFSGDYNDLINKPDLKPVATSGDYNDLVNKPTKSDLCDSVKDCVTGWISDSTQMVFDTLHNYYATKKELRDTASALRDVINTEVTQLQHNIDTVSDNVRGALVDTVVAIRGALVDTAGNIRDALVDTAAAIRADMGDAAHDAKITIQKNGVTVGDFTLNQSTPDTIDILVPTKVTDLEDADNYVTKAKLNDTLGAYTTTSQIDTLLGDYATIAYVKDTLKAYYDTTLTKKAIHDTANALRGEFPTVNNGKITIAMNRGTVDQATFYVNQDGEQTVMINLPDEALVNNGQLTIITDGDTTRFTANQSGNDTVNLSGFVTTAHLNDTLNAYYTKRQIKDTLVNFASKDTLVNFARKDTLVNFARKDTLVNFARKDTLVNFARKDTLVNFARKDTLVNFARKDTLVNFARKDTLVNFARKDTLVNFARKDTLVNFARKDTLVNFARKDTLVNFARKDTLVNFARKDTLVNFARKDTLVNFARKDTLVNFARKDTLVNFARKDTLVNFARKDTLVNFARKDTLVNFARKDTLVNFARKDTLVNFARKDTLVNFARKDTLVNFARKDTLVNFARKDTLVNFARKDTLVNFARKDTLVNFARKDTLTKFALKEEIGDGTLTITKGAESVTFTANQKTNSDVSIPTKLSEMTNDGGVYAKRDSVNVFTQNNKFTGVDTFSNKNIVTEHGFFFSGTDSTTTENCQLMVNACDLLAVFDSLRKRIDSISLALAQTQEELNELKNSTPPTVSLTLSEVHSNSFKATATANGNGSTITSFQFCISENSDMSNPTCTESLTGNNGTYEFTFNENIDGNKTYYVMAKATNLAGTGTDTKNTRTPAHVPTATLALSDTVPSGFIVKLTGINLKESENGTITICYKEGTDCPADATGTTCETPDVAITIPVGTTADTVLTVFNLEETTDYCVFVTVSNGDSTWSDQGNVTTGAAVALGVEGPEDGKAYVCSGTVSPEIGYKAKMLGDDIDNYDIMWNTVPAEGATITPVGVDSCTIVYSVVGTFKVKCTATPKSGTDAALRDSVNTTVANAENPTLVTCTEDYMVSIKEALSANVASMDWGDGTTNTETSHTYQKDSTYTLTAISEKGCKATKEVTVTGGKTIRPCHVNTVHNSLDYQNNGWQGAKNDGFETPSDTNPSYITTVTDYDGNVYPVVQIGGQCWLAENMRCTHSPSGEHKYLVKTLPGNAAIKNSRSKVAQWYGNDSVTYAPKHFGLLYNWCAAVDTYDISQPEVAEGDLPADGKMNCNFPAGHRRGICPKGWHVPTSAEWTTMELHVNGSPIAGASWRGTHAGKLSNGCDWKEESCQSNAPSDYGNSERNVTGFSVLPAGMSATDYNEVITNYYTSDACFWTSETNTNALPIYRRFEWSKAGVYLESQVTHAGLSVRCVRDEASIPTEATLFVTPNDTSVCVNDVVTFTATTNIGDYTYSWSDGGTTEPFTGPTFTVSYPATGIYYVTCTATNSENSQLFASSVIRVVSANKPNFTFAVDTTSVIIKTVTENTSIADWGGSGTEGGRTARPSIGVYTYDESGIYNISVLNDDGCVTTKAVAVGNATLHPCAVTAAHPAQTDLSGSGQETPLASSQNSIISVSDFEGNVYPVVQIGSRCWMKTNLRTRYFSDGTVITNGTENGTLDSEGKLVNVISMTTPYYYRPVSNSSNRNFKYGEETKNTGGSSEYKVASAYSEKLHGLYYNWSAVMDAKGICPQGWHVPSAVEWNMLIGYVVNDLGAQSDKYAYLLSESNDWYNDTEIDYSPNYYSSDSRNASEFSAVVSGFAGGSSKVDEVNKPYQEGRFFYRAHNYAQTDFWSSSSSGGDLALALKLEHSETQLVAVDRYKDDGYSVRCVRDAEDGGTVQTAPSVSTDSASSIMETSAIIYATITNPDYVPITDKGFKYKTEGGSWDIIPGTGVGKNFSADLTGLTGSTNYTYQAFIKFEGGADTVFGETKTFTTTGFVCGSSTISDVDDNTYNTVQIGSQCWMRSNLYTTKYADGTPIANGGNISNVSTTTSYYYDYNAFNYDLPVVSRGYLYNWAALMNDAAVSNTNPSNVQGVCPTGWHVPSRAEWVQLKNYLSENNEYWCGGNSEYIAKALAAVTSGWGGASGCDVGSSSPANNATQFTAIPTDYEFNSIAGYCARFWTSMQNTDGDACYYWLAQNRETLIRSYADISNAYSVRCVKDEDGSATQTPPSVTTGGYSPVTQNTATLSATITNHDDVIITRRGFKYKADGDSEYQDVYTTVELVDTTVNYTESIENLNPGTTYYYYAYIIYQGGTGIAEGDVASFQTAQPSAGFVCGTSTVADGDGHVYHTTVIGSQCWLTENLRTTVGGSIHEYEVGMDMNHGRYYIWPSQDVLDEYDFDVYDTATYGLYYSRYAALGYDYNSSDPVPDEPIQGICPSGWHIPSKSEWEALIQEISFGCTDEWDDWVDECGAGKLAGGDDWEDYSGYYDDDIEEMVYYGPDLSAPGNYFYNSRNSTGFNALPSGGIFVPWYDDYGPFDSFYPLEEACFWSSSFDGGNTYYYFNIRYLNVDFKIDSDASYAFPVRCVRDSE